MSYAPPLSRSAGGLCLASAVLVVLSQLLRLGVGLALGPGSAATVVHTLTYGVALLGTGLLMLALTALYCREATALGPLGLSGYLVAFVGTMLVAGDWWFEAFVVPAIAVRAPEILAAAPGGSVVAGAVITSALFAVGWTVFGIAVWRARVAARPAAVLMVVGGLVGVLTLATPWQIPLAVAVGWVGSTLRPAT